MSDGFDVKKFVESFSTLAAADGGVATLRGMVLDLAVRGSLTREEESDEPAARLLARVSNDEVGHPEIEARYAVPPSWAWTTLGRICSYIQRGKSPKYVDASPVPVVSQKCVQWEGFLIDRARFVDPASLQTYAPERLLREGDLLWNSTGHGTVGRVAVYTAKSAYRKVVADSHVTVVRPKVIDSRFIWCWLASPSVQKTIDGLVTGSTKQTELATSTVSAHPVPIPPLAEQKRIVAKVDELMKLIDDLEAQQTKATATQSRFRTSALDALTKAEGPEELAVAWKRVAGNFEVLFEHETSIRDLRGCCLDLAVHGRFGSDHNAATGLPEGWHWETTESVASQLTDGEHLTPPRLPGGVPLVTAKNVRDGHMDFQQTDFVAPGVAERCWNRCRPQVGDLLMVSVGATTGRICVLADPRPFVIVRSVALLRPETTRMTAGFLAIALRCPAGQRQIWAGVKEQAQPGLYLGRMKQIRVPVPPLAEQKRIVAKVEALMKLCDDLEAKLAAKQATASKLVEAVVRELVA